MLAHMVRTRPEMPVTQNLLFWNRTIEPMSQMQADLMKANSAIYPTGNGCMVFNMDTFSGVPRVLTRLLHELTHAAVQPNRSHGPAFYSTLRFLMRVATEELGWTLEASCREACFGTDDKKGTNRPDQFCPKCLWQSPTDKCVLTTEWCAYMNNQDELNKLLTDPELGAKAKEFLSKTRPPKKA